MGFVKEQLTMAQCFNFCPLAVTHQCPIFVFYSYSVWRRNCLLKHVLEGKMEGRIKVTWRRRRRRQQPLDDLMEIRGYWKLNEVALDLTLWRNGFGKGYGPIVRRTTEWMTIDAIPGCWYVLSPTTKETNYSDQTLNVCKPLKNNSEGCPSNQFSAAAMTSASDKKWRPFNCFFSRVGLRTYQHPCINLSSASVFKWNNALSSVKSVKFVSYPDSLGL